MLPKGKWWTVMGVGILLLVLASPFIFEFGRVFYFRWKIHDPVRAREVLQAARELHSEYLASGIGEIWNPPPDKWRAAIRDLSPSYVFVSAEKVHVEMGGGNLHHGIDCFPDGIAGEGRTKIIDGMWYVSEIP